METKRFFKDEDYPFINGIFNLLIESTSEGYMVSEEAAEREEEAVKLALNTKCVDSIINAISEYERSGFILGYITALRVMQGKLM